MSLNKKMQSAHNERKESLLFITVLSPEIKQ